MKSKNIFHFFLMEHKRYFVQFYLLLFILHNNSNYK